MFAVDYPRRRSRVVKTVLRGTPLTLRTNSSDFSVAVASLVGREYDRISVGNPAVIIDAGANIGTSAIAFARRFPNARIFAIEMERENADLLAANVAGYPMVTVVHAALAGSSGQTEIKNRFTGPWGYTIADTTGRTAATGQKVRCITLDELMREFGIDHIDLLKLDIEGAEKAIFEAGGVWLAKTDVIVAELHDRIVTGCTRAFYAATSGFPYLEKHGEKVAVYRTPV